MNCFHAFVRAAGKFAKVGMTRELRPMIMCGPSGSGKSTLVEMLMKEYPHTFKFCVSHTTRQPRPGEEHGKHYFFTTKEQMTEDIQANKFVEHATFGGNMYGTSKAAINTVLSHAKVAILDIEIQGVKQVKTSDYKFHYVFIAPPSIGALKERLLKRKTETPESIQARIEQASKEMEYGMTKGNFDLIIVNDDLEQAYSQLKAFVLANVHNNPK